MYRNFKIQVEGRGGLLLSNVQYSDPLGEAAKQKQHFTDKKGKAKTDDVHRAVRILDWLYSCYWKQEGTVVVDETDNTIDFDGFSTPYLPGANFQRCLRNAAIEYDGPKDAIEMINSKQPKLALAAFTSRGVWVNRVYFPSWRAKFELMLDDEIMGIDQLRKIANMGGKAEGLGTWRPSHGRFQVESIEEVDA